MEPRVDYKKASPEALAAIGRLEDYVRRSGLEPSLLELVKLRASQINGYAFCIDMHTKDARARGESEQRLYTLQVWREMPFFSERERAALAWTECVTQIRKKGLPDAIFEAGANTFRKRNWWT